MIDLRSDTVTRPTAPMLAAMTSAEVGDDVWGDDPTVLRLQATVAERTGKEAGLFFPSGTQSNLAALMAHCARGDEYIVGQLAHTYKYEGGGAAVLGSIQPQPVEHAADGSLPLEKLAAALKPERDLLFQFHCLCGSRRIVRTRSSPDIPSIMRSVTMAVTVDWASCSSASAAFCA